MFSRLAQLTAPDQLSLWLLVIVGLLSCGLSNSFRFSRVFQIAFLSSKCIEIRRCILPDRLKLFVGVGEAYDFVCISCKNLIVKLKSILVCAAQLAKIFFWSFVLSPRWGTLESFPELEIKEVWGRRWCLLALSGSLRTAANLCLRMTVPLATVQGHRAPLLWGVVFLREDSKLGLLLFLSDKLACLPQVLF